MRVQNQRPRPGGWTVLSLKLVQPAPESLDIRLMFGCTSVRDRSGLGSELAALDDGRDIGAVVGEHVLEHVSGFVEAGFLGDDAQMVLVAPAGGADLEASMGGRRRDERVADVDGVALVPVGGGGVAEPDV